MNNILFVAIALVATSIVALGIYFKFGRKGGISEQQKSWRRSIAISVIRLKRFEFLDGKALALRVGADTNSKLGKKFFNLIGNRQIKFGDFEPEDAEKFELSISEIEKEIDKIGFSSEDLYKLSIALWNIGIVGYGLPVRDLIQDERLLTPILYRLAKGDGDFHLDEKMRDALDDIKGTYYVFTKFAGQKNVYKSILFVGGYQIHEEILIENEKPLRDQRAIAFEISKEPRFQNPIIRAGIFVPFAPHSMAFMSTKSRLCEHIRNGNWQSHGAIAEDASFHKLPGYVLDDSFKFITIERRPNRLLKGAFLDRDTIGKFIGIEFPSQINDEIVASLGIVNESEIEEMHDLERIAIDELRSSFEKDPNLGGALATH